MALAETVLRKIYKLGLLPKIIQKLPLVSALLAVFSVAWLLVLPMDGQFRNTYISENALMPGQVNSYFRESEWNHVRGFRSEVTKWNFDEVAEHNPALEEWFSSFGWTLSHHTKDNVSTMYSVMYAPRGDNTEALVLAVPYFTSSGEANYGGFALAPALARYFSRMSIWSKNIIFVFPRDSRSVLRSWVEAYHTTLDVTAGSIEAAIVMEYPSQRDSFSHMELFYEGLNGQLPNLDLINVATTNARHENMKVSVQETPTDELDDRTYWTRLRVLAKGILRLAVAGVEKKTYGCESFSGWQIQAITIRAVGQSGPDVTQFGRIVDSTFRSVNNLLEKFHQSFFFYLLLSPTNFVSIGTYLPSAALVAGSFVVSSIYSFACGVSIADFLSQIGNVLMIFTGVETLCLGASVVLQKLASEIDADSAFWPVAIAGTVAAAAVASLSNFVKVPFTLSRPISYMLLSFALFFVAMLVVSLLIVHFSLALAIGVCALPLTVIQTLINKPAPTAQAALKNKVKISLALFVSCPITVITVLGYFLGGAGSGVVSLWHALLTSWQDMQNWTWFVVALGWFPAWVTVAFTCAFGDFSLPQKTKNE